MNSTLSLRMQVLTLRKIFGSLNKLHGIFFDAINNSYLTIEEFETSFKFLKRNKAAGINSNIVLDTYDKIQDILSLRLIFNKALSLIC